MSSVSSDVWETAAPAASRSLSDKHRRILVEESGIDEEILEERGYHSLDKAVVVTLVVMEVLHPIALDADEWMAIPIYRPDGQKHGEVVRVYGGKSKAKYIFPTGERNAFDVHPGYLDYTTDTSIPAIFTEGVKKADAILSAAEREGINCIVIAVNGCWGWHAKIDGSPMASPDFQDIAWDGRKVYVVSDSDYRNNDDVRKGWSECAAYIAGKTGPHRTQLVVVPPNGVDKQGADDWLAAGHSLLSLLELAQSPEYTRLAVDTTRTPLPIKSGMLLIRESGERIPHIYEPLIPERAVMLMAGHSGTYKTWHCLSLALDAAFGFPWLSHPDLVMRGDPVTSLYVNKEMSGSILGHRLKSMARAERYTDVGDWDDIIDRRLHFADEAALDLNIQGQRDRLEDAIMQAGARMVILDSLSMCWHGNENDSSEVGALYAQLRGITERTGVTWIIVHHLTKPQGTKQNKEPSQFQVRGSGQLFQQADAVIMLNHYITDMTTPEEKLLAIHHTKARTDIEMPAFVVRFDTHDGLYVSLKHMARLLEIKASAYAKSHGDPTKLSAWMVESMLGFPALTAGPGMRFRQLASLLKASWTEDSPPPADATIRRQLKAMVDDKAILVVEENKRLGALYKLPPSTEGVDTKDSGEVS